MIDVNRYSGVVVLLAVGLVSAACGGGDGGTPNAASAAASTTRVINVEVVEVTSESFSEFINVTGAVEASRDVVVAAEEAGIVRALLVERGRTVRAGQAIARLDDQLIRAQYDQAVAEAALARETWERQRRLWEEDRIGSELNYLQTKYRAETAAAQQRALAARLERTTIRAPIAGVLDDRFVEVGATVSPGTPIARVVDAGAVKIQAGVPERYAGDIQSGGDAVVTFDHIIGEEFRAQTRFVGTALNEQNRTFPVELTMTNRNGLLKPGMVAKVRVGRRSLDGALLVPREAVLRSATGHLVYVVVEEAGISVAQAREVVPGPTQQGRVLIEAGLQPGDRVIVVGQQQVAGGDLVRVVGERGTAQP